MTRERQWQITGGLFALSPAAMYFGLEPSAPEWTHVAGLLALVYLIAFVVAAPIIWAAYEPPRRGPSLERNGGPDY